MKKQIVFNRIINNEYKKKQDGLLALKIQNAKSSLDFNCPESFDFFKTKFKKGLYKNKCMHIYIFNVEI